MQTLSDCVFAWMRREFARLLGVCEQEIRADTPLSRFLPRERRREFWQIGQKQLGLRFPTLMLPPSLARAERWLAIGSSLRSLILALLFAPKWLAVPLAFLSGVVTSALFHLVTRPWATEHAEIQTFGDLSAWLLARNMKKFRREFGLQPNHDEIYLTIKSMLVEMGVDPATITPDASFSGLLDC